MSAEPAPAGPNQASYDTASLIDEVDAAFARQFGAQPELYALAPGRINLIGEHTDYTGGMVLPIAIDRRLAIAARKIDGPTAFLASTGYPEQVEIDVDHEVPPAIGHWSTYFLGVLAGFQRKGTEIPAFQALIHSHLPQEVGLSSSAAYEVAATTLLQALTGKVLEPLESIFIAQKAEEEFAGVPCGIMDQFISTVAQEDHALLLDCDQLEARHILLPSHEVEILIFDTGVSNLPFRADYRERRAQTEEAAAVIGVKRLSRATPEWLVLREVELGQRLFRRARHVLSENQRVVAASRLMEQGDWVGLGRLMGEAQRSLEDDFEISHPRTRRLLALQQEIPSHDAVFGARVTGMGFGGSVIFLVRADAADAVAAEVQDAYFQETGHRPQVIFTRASQGVELFGNLETLHQEDLPGSIVEQPAGQSEKSAAGEDQSALE